MRAQIESLPDGFLPDEMLSPPPRRATRQE